MPNVAFASIGITGQALADADIGILSQLITATQTTKNATLATFKSYFQSNPTATTQITLTDVLTNATNKVGLLGIKNFTNASANLAVISGTSTTSTGVVNIGGGSASQLAATQLNFFTAANNATATGTNRAAIFSSGRVQFAAGGVGADQNSNPVQIVSGDGTNHLGLFLTSSFTNATVKRGGIRGGHYTSAQADICLLRYASGVTSNAVIIGDTVGDATGVTDFYISLVSSNTTLGGTLVAQWNASGLRIEPVGVSASADASCVIDLVSITKGLGLCSMSTTNRDAISTPREGLLIHNSTTHVPNFYSGTAWTAFLTGTISLTSQVSGILPVANGGSGIGTATGTAGNLVLSINPTFTPSSTAGIQSRFQGGTASGTAGSASGEIAIGSGAAGTGGALYYDFSGSGINNFAFIIKNTYAGGNVIIRIGSFDWIFGTDGFLTLGGGIKDLVLTSSTTSHTTLQIKGGTATGTANVHSGELMLGDGDSGTGAAVYYDYAASFALDLKNLYSGGDINLIIGSNVFKHASSGVMVLPGPIALLASASDPSSPSAGWLYYNTGDAGIRYYTGSAWKKLIGI